jgi:coenzyme F420-reducing hydrogenase beta subunit
LCYQLCPAHGHTKDETGIGRDLYGSVEGIMQRIETGYYLSSWLGYSKVNGHRPNGASGGMATWTLETLLESGKVGAVACVGRTRNPDKLFEFKICTKVEEIRQCGRSAYYPVEISHIIRHILKNEGRYAIIGLPCVCKAIRLAQEKLPKLKERIQYVLGLTCGHSCSKYFAEYLCALGGGDPHDLHEIVFRVKDSNEPVSNMGMYFLSGQGESEKSGCLRWRDGFGFAFMNGYFQMQGCFFCDDIFAECADATYMDAWLPEYASQPEGYSIVLVRNNRIQDLISEADTEKLELTALSIEQVIKSQPGAMRLRTQNRWVHLQESQKADNHTPVKRKIQLKPITNPFRCKAIRLHKVISDQSAKLWIETNSDIKSFEKIMSGFRKKLKTYNLCASVHRIPIIVFRRFVKCFLSDK